MSDEQSVVDILIEASKKKVEFSLETEQEGKLEFGFFAVWRDQALSANIDRIETMDSKIFAKNVMKFALYRYNDLIIDYDEYENNKSIFDNINLNINEYEIRQFAEKFLEINESMLYERYSEDISQKDDYNIEEFKDRARKNRKPLFEIPEDILEKLKLTFITHYKRQKELTEKILGLKIPKNFSYASDIIKQHNKMNEIFKIKEQINPMKEIKAQTNITKKDSLNPKMNGQLNNILQKQSDYKSKVDKSILRTPILIETVIEYQMNMIESIDLQVDKLIQTQKLVTDANNLHLKASNEILQEQLETTERNSKSSDLKANIALWISIGSLIVTTLIGGYQIYDSNKTSLKNFEKQDMVIESITNGNEIFKEQIDTTNKIINELINDNKSLKDKITELEKKLK